MLQEKHNAACFHKVREAGAMNVIRVAKIDGPENLADLFTALLATITRKKHLELLCVKDAWFRVTKASFSWSCPILVPSSSLLGLFSTLHLITQRKGSSSFWSQ
jgi:hypothetical protein